jgi:hypothetical protein
LNSVCRAYCVLQEVKDSFTVFGVIVDDGSNQLAILFGQSTPGAISRKNHLVKEGKTVVAVDDAGKSLIAERVAEASHAIF